MASRYFGSWTDTEGNEYEWRINGQLYISTAEFVDVADIRWGFDAGEDIFQPIRAHYVNLSLVATTAQDLDDLFTEEDNYWYLFLEKNGQEIFRGGISTENSEQPFDTDVWVIELEARDALGWLDDLAFVQTNGTPWTGSQSVIKTIARALQRGYGDAGYEMSIKATSTFSLTDDTSFLQNAYVEMDSFVDEDGEPQKCLDVVQELVGSIGCTIFQYQGVMYLMNIYEWQRLSLGDLTAEVFLSDGTFTGLDTFPGGGLISQQNVGTLSVNDSDVIHVNRALTYLNGRPTYSTKWYHEFELRENIIRNGELEAPEEEPGPYTMPFWTLQATRAVATKSTINIDGAYGNAFLLAAESDPIKLRKGNTITLEIDVEFGLAGNDPELVIIQIEIDNGVDDPWYFVGSAPAGTGTWYQFDGGVIVFSWVYYLVTQPSDVQDNAFVRYTIDLGGMPITGDFNIRLYQPEYTGSSNPADLMIVREVIASATSNIEEGVEWSAFRNDTKNGKVQDVREVRFSTSDSAALKNTFYDVNDAVITTIKRPPVGVSESLLEANATLEHWLKYNRTKLIQEEVQGPIEHYMPKSLLDLGGKYLMTYMEKNLATDVASITLVGVSEPTAAAQTDTEEVYRLKDTIKPKIKS